MRRDTDQDWKQHVVRLKNEEGVIGYYDSPTEDEGRKFNKKSTGKNLSNKD